ncbi:MAG: hypothetical protein AUI14_03385 [Actinobacteria bacterium 13_2_20CM_2_71_6]|nr:MAG: hypothetical protein AUI14_03385 [Actinobacteria bacterium 13_2_20CM_2_71_6]
MTDDHVSTERFSDAEIAFLRYVRFGALPSHTTPDEWVELQETDAPRDVPEPAGDRQEWQVRGSYG